MPRRRNDPAGVSDNPIFVTDSVRVAELMAELSRRLTYVKQNFRLGEKLALSTREYNKALRDFKSAVARGTPRKRPLKRVHPLIEMVISRHARRLARERTGLNDAEVEGQDIREASKIAADALNPIPHRPRADNLQRHVIGLMALLQEFSGKPVLTGRYRNSCEDYHFKPGFSEIVPMLFRDIDPSITVTQLVNIVERARRKYAGEPMEFLDFFPLYGAQPDENGSLILQGDWALEEFEPNIPTYYH